MKIVYVVQALLELPNRWFDLASCYTVPAALAVVGALLDANKRGGYELRVVTREEPYV